MDELHVKQENKSEETVKNLTVDIKLLAKWTGILFWLIILQTISGVFTSENVEKAVPALAAAGGLAKAVFTAVYGAVLLKIASESIRYRSAALCCFMASMAGLILAGVSNSIDSPAAVAAAFISVVIGMLGEYYEYMAHAEVLDEVNWDFSRKWYKLWKWYLATFLGIIGGTVVTVMIPFIGMLIVLASTVGNLAVSVGKIIYIYKMSKVFGGSKPADNH